MRATHTVWKEHRYELDGFKSIFWEEVLAGVLNDPPPAAERTVDMPVINVELYGHPPYPPLSGLEPTSLARVGDNLVIHAMKGDFGIRFALDFKNERLHFDIESDLAANDDGSAEAADALAEIGRFTRDYWCNGKLRIVHAETGNLISRKDAFIPVNCRVDVKAFNAQIAHWKKLAAERRTQ